MEGHLRRMGAQIAFTPVINGLQHRGEVSHRIDAGGDLCNMADIPSGCIQLARGVPARPAMHAPLSLRETALLNQILRPSVAGDDAPGQAPPTAATVPRRALLGMQH